MLLRLLAPGGFVTGWNVRLNCWLVILGVAGVGNAQVIPTNRTFTSAWQNAGHPGPIPSPAQIVNVRDFKIGRAHV